MTRPVTSHTEDPAPETALGKKFSASLETFRAARPRQWIKNVLVFAAPASAGRLNIEGVLGRSLAAFAILTFASAGCYLVNDAIDATSDRSHPVKSQRPVADGRLTVRRAVATGCILMVIALVCAVFVAVPLLVIVGTYLALTLSYSLGFKRVAVLELGIVSSGFVLRAAAGGAATHIPLSPWFLIVSSAGSLFVVAGKRATERSRLGTERNLHRSVLDQYPEPFLRSVRLIGCSVAVTAYCLWVFESSQALTPISVKHYGGYLQLSIVPFVLALLVVELAIESGRGGEPEELALKDHSLQLLAVVWLVLFLLGIYL